MVPVPANTAPGKSTGTRLGCKAPSLLFERLEHQENADPNCWRVQSLEGDMVIPISARHFLLGYFWSTRDHPAPPMSPFHLISVPCSEKFWIIVRNGNSLDNNLHSANSFDFLFSLSAEHSGKALLKHGTHFSCRDMLSDFLISLTLECWCHLS